VLRFWLDLSRFVNGEKPSIVSRDDAKKWRKGRKRKGKSSANEVSQRISINQRHCVAFGDRDGIFSSQKIKKKIQASETKVIVIKRKTEKFRRMSRLLCSGEEFDTFLSANFVAYFYEKLNFVLSKPSNSEEN
jgi:hypothetical protein